MPGFDFSNPASAGSSLTYVGTYDPAHTYHDGDYVVGPDGITYVCVKEGTVGVTPTPWAPAPTIPYGTSLPASPVDGQEAVLVDSVTNPSYQWRFRYNAGSSSAYKWEFVGGAQAALQANTTETSTTVGAYFDLPTLLRIVLPRAGDYDQIIGSTVAHSAAGVACYLAGARNTSVVWQTSIVTRTAADSYALSPLSFRWTGCAAGDDLRARYYCGSAGTASWSSRWINVIPVRVS